MIFEGIYRRFSGLKGGKGPIDARFTQQESLAVANVEPPGLEMTRAGRRFLLGVTGAVTGIAPVQAIPTTVAQWVLFNTDVAGGVTAWVEELMMLLLSGTPGLGGSLWMALFDTPAQTGGNAAGLGIENASRSSRGSKLIVKSNVTITTPAAPVWIQLDESRDSIAAAAFSTGYANGFSRRDLVGRIAIPPQKGLGLAIMAPAGTTPLYGPNGSWIEQESDLE